MFSITVNDTMEAVFSKVLATIDVGYETNRAKEEMSTMAHLRMKECKLVFPRGLVVSADNKNDVSLMKLLKQIVNIHKAVQTAGGKCPLNDAWAVHALCSAVDWWYEERMKDDGFASSVFEQLIDVADEEEVVVLEDLSAMLGGSGGGRVKDVFGLVSEEEGDEEEGDVQAEYAKAKVIVGMSMSKGIAWLLLVCA